MESESDDKSSAVGKEPETEDLIAELCLNAPSEAVKFCLRNYQYGRRLAQLEKDFLKQKQDVLRDTADYLNIPGFKDKTKEPLAHLAICRIQNLLPDDCNVCNARYRISNSEKAILECSICGQGVHKECWVEIAKAMSIENPEVSTGNFNWDATTFKAIYNPLKLPGLFYICEECKPNVIPSEDEGNYKRGKSNNEAPPQTEVTPTDEAESILIDASQNQNEGNGQIITSQPATQDLPASETVTQWHNPVGDDDDGISITSEHPSNKDPPENGKSDTLCRFFRDGNCKYGMKGRECKFTHPKVCAKFSQHGTRQPRGCNRGKKCKDFHPKMCLNSLRKGECFSESCRFNHVKGTKRHPPVVLNQVGSSNVSGGKQFEPKCNSGPENKAHSNTNSKNGNKYESTHYAPNNQRVNTSNNQTVNTSNSQYLKQSNSQHIKQSNSKHIKSSNTQHSKLKHNFKC